MPSIAIDATKRRPAVTIEAPLGGRLLDLCDEAGAPVPFSCRGESCGTCRVSVLAGAELLEPPGPVERQTLAHFDAGSGVRLACVARVREGEGHVHLALANDPT